MGDRIGLSSRIELDEDGMCRCHGGGGGGGEESDALHYNNCMWRVEKGGRVPGLGCSCLPIDREQEKE